MNRYLFLFKRKDKQNSQGTNSVINKYSRQFTCMVGKFSSKTNSFFKNGKGSHLISKIGGCLNFKNS